MSRYTTSRILIDDNAKRYLSTTLLPKIPISKNDTYIQITSPDRLDRIALSYYGNSTLWYVIAAANNIGKGTMMVGSGVILRIPEQNNIQQLINSINVNR
jgi:hypothetical protein